MRTYKRETLIKKLERLNERRHAENLRLHGVMNNIGWGTGMRCSKCTPSFSKLDRIDEQIREVEQLLSTVN